MFDKGCLDYEDSLDGFKEGLEEDEMEEISLMLRQTGINKPSDHLLTLIDEEVSLLPKMLQDPNRIIIGGYSQGAIVTLSSLLSYRKDVPLGGSFCFGGILGYVIENT